jgi:GT2 family glycosyltransferase
MTGHPIVPSGNDEENEFSESLVHLLLSIGTFLSELLDNDVNLITKEHPSEFNGFLNHLSRAVYHWKNQNLNKNSIAALSVLKGISAFSLWYGFYNQNSHISVESKPISGTIFKRPTTYSENFFTKSTSVIIPTTLLSNEKGSLTPFQELLNSLSLVSAIKKIFVIGEINDNAGEKLKISEKVEFVKLLKDIGPANARNNGIDLSIQNDFDCTLFIDDDVIISSPNQMEKIISMAISKNSPIAPIIESKKETAFDVYHDIDGTLNGLYISKINHKELFYATTCVLAVPNSILHDGIRFDTSFRTAAGEDIDFSMRIRSSGYSITAADDIRITHDYGYYNSTEALRKFVNRYIRYGDGNRRILEKYPDYYSQINSTDFRPTIKRPRTIPAIAKELEILISKATIALQ